MESEFNANHLMINSGVIVCQMMCSSGQKVKENVSVLPEL